MGRTSGPISLIVADDEPDIIEYLVTLLTAEGFDVRGSASTADGIVRLAAEAQPDVALLDLRMPGGGLDAALRISGVSASTRVVVFSAQSTAIGVLPLLSAGIAGYVVKGGPPERLVEAIRDAVDGGAYLAPEVSKVALAELSSRLHREEQAALREGWQTERVAAVIAGEQFRSVFQPIVDLHTGETRGVEALTRFSGSPPRPPNVWFDEADEVGQRIPLELATARAAVRTLQSMRRPLFMTVNISPETALSGRLDTALRGVDLSRVVLEITEHSPVTDYPRLAAALAPLRRRGAQLAVDDAGGGYASFSHILNLSPEFIKLDIGLIRAIDSDVRRQALGRALCGFASELGVSVIAEGVETAGELGVVRGIGAPLAQGFHLGRPMPLDAQPDLLVRPPGDDGVKRAGLAS